MTQTASLVDTPTPLETGQAGKLAELAKALAHPARVQIVCLLLERGNCICGDLVEELHLAQSTVSEHLRILKAAGVILGTIDHPKVCYALQPGHMAPLADLLAAMAAADPRGTGRCGV
ncbi:transcriptional regulator, ArsR family [Ectothiorhodosinus mongolicus]|uniref:Transcriptional regulator, ArsR family n=1 Tax=Ectothiorhodosinus mongolicus TaxID=233100 RepID=A0A1R3W7I1_9GAMM|nr:metalloregulator ArsR/SmtB family transcription factor [Ectothiorhodosinus mongolicus]ULX57559.1 ArsR family transcriptional regulator [Ectothiorhodosinus mongolicus]SIT72796.1 transcriptional regulator, ArsR family [Ectothiorhodosinus mongolicus]